MVLLGGGFGLGVRIFGVYLVLLGGSFELGVRIFVLVVLFVVLLLVLVGFELGFGEDVWVVVLGS